MHGLAGNDLLTDNGGADTLDGGTGTDTMVGGAGNDSYVVDNAKDVINELGGDLDDRVLASIAVDLQLAVFAGIEHATLTGAAALNATGNAGANMLIGNIGANVLDGGTGNDTLIGGAGNDTYKVDSVSDVVIERPGEGTDMVISTATDYALGNFVENLTLADNLASNGIGNALANKITGNSNINDLEGGDGNDTLIGNDGADSLDGSAGADSLVGGTGADTYNVDNVGDKISESGPASDVDRVISTITFTLGANLENLQLSGPDAIDGTGNALNNLLRGSTASNVLSGLAGNDSLDGVGGDDLLLGGDGNDLLTASLGFDTLVGGAGSDRFAFENKGASLTGLDVIADFNGLPGGDAIDVSNVLVGFVEDSSNVNDFLRAVQANGSTTLQVDRDGAGAVTAFVDMVVLQGVSTSISGLLNNGSLVLD
jgi:Ca2+-binding RTX toxin-like protein